MEPTVSRNLHSLTSFNADTVNIVWARSTDEGHGLNVDPATMDPEEIQAYHNQGAEDKEEEDHTFGEWELTLKAHKNAAMASQTQRESLEPVPKLLKSVHWKTLAKHQMKESGIPLDRKAREKLRTSARHHHRKTAPVQILQSKDLQIDNLPISSNGWQGKPYPVDEGRVLKKMYEDGNIVKALRSFTKVPFDKQQNGKTYIVDSAGRICMVRSFQPAWVLGLMYEIIQEVDCFMKACRWESNKARESNNRGNHFFCIAGPDRQNKKVPNLRPWGRANKEVVDSFFAKGRPFARINHWVNQFLDEEFPAISARFRNCGEYYKKKYPDNTNTHMPFGHFFNWCLNAPIPGFTHTPNHHDPKDPPPHKLCNGAVLCRPHVDSKNLAIAVCLLFIYGKFDDDELCWLVIWEAGIIIQLPVGVLFAYPSAIFYHFNINLSDIEAVVTRNRERPTRDNSSPLTGWQDNQVRGSMVWFNQATMFTSSELNITTLKAAREQGKAEGKGKGKDGDYGLTYDVKAALKEGMFPSV